eukprot:scaffold122872_cov75-Phaeocystis_antarctica.AAC.1
MASACQGCVVEDRVTNRSLLGAWPSRLDCGRLGGLKTRERYPLYYMHAYPGDNSLLALHITVS